MSQMSPGLNIPVYWNEDTPITADEPAIRFRRSPRQKKAALRAAWRA